jgi:hypothetical protein
MHDAHLKYQRAALAADAQNCDNYVVALECPEGRGLRRVASPLERKSQEFKLEWFTGLRPNFWKAYFETLEYMSR